MKTLHNIINVSKLDNNLVRIYFNGKFVRDAQPNTKFFKHEKNTFSFLAIETPDELCKFLRVPIEEMESIINNPTYKHFQIAKKRGGYRDIYEPVHMLKPIQRKLNFYLQAYYLSIKPNPVNGFIINPHYLKRQANIVTNAQPHAGRKYLLNVDLMDFFPNIKAKYVKELFLSDYFNFNDQIATALTLLMTYKGFLPIGAPTSPVISNFICCNLDDDLIKFCQTYDLSYSRYADDLTFSSNKQITQENLSEIFNIIGKNSFLVNDKKVRISSSNRKQVVTGLLVNQKVNVDRKLIRKVRAMIHDYDNNGLYSATKKHFDIETATRDQKIKFLDRLVGYLHFIRQVRGKDDLLYSKLNENYRKAYLRHYYQ